MLKEVTLQSRFFRIEGDVNEWEWFLKQLGIDPDTVEDDEITITVTDVEYDEAN